MLRSEVVLEESQFCITILFAKNTIKINYLLFLIICSFQFFHFRTENLLSQSPEIPAEPDENPPSETSASLGCLESQF